MRHKWMGNKSREEMLLYHYSKKIMKVLSEEIDEKNIYPLCQLPLSYNEAVKILQYTIEELKNQAITL